MRSRIFSLGVLAPLIFAGATALAEEARAPEPQSYRMQDYRSPTPPTLAGARVLTTAEAAELWRSGQGVFIDVVARAPRPANLPEGTLWRDKPRSDIPGSIWLADTGYGALNPAMEAYFRKNIDRIAGSAREKTLVFYCLKDCWMSWNAAKRAAAMGYPHIAWYPEGTDGWTAAGLPVELKEPAPRPET